MKQNFLAFFSLLIILSSCANFVEKVQSDIKRQKMQEQQRESITSMAGKQKTSKNDERKIADPLTYTAYGEDEKKRDKNLMGQRKTRNDFTDQGNGGSLWSNYDNSTSFFTNATTIHEGDIVVLEVLEEFKKSITRELRKAYPPYGPGNIFTAAQTQSMQQDAANSTSSAAVKSNETTAGGVNPLTGPIAKEGGAKEDADKEVAEIVYDKISARVVEKISGDHVIIKGKKEVIFRNKKRYVEINAMAKATDIEDGGKIKSDKIIESRITVLK
ncbi:MAG: flagellar basal body L-ring protein FlgH [Bacteriovoracaceae bacterium]|nr:flagellar basal body L-ring protein FlgH [Bacteriovoracaceae bacterium]